MDSPQFSRKDPAVAMTPGTCRRFIGRVGALAVALGIGTAIAYSPGPAIADDAHSPDTSATASDAAGTRDTSSATGGSADTAASDGLGQRGEIAGGSGGDKGTTPDEEDDQDDQVAEAGEDDQNAEAGQDDPNAEAGETHAGAEVEPGSALLNERYEAPSRQSTGGPTTRGGQAPSTMSAVPTPPAADDSLTRERTPTLDTAPQPQSPELAAVAVTPTAYGTTTLMRSAPSAATMATVLSAPPAATTATTRINGLVTSVLSALGFGPQAALGPTTPPQPPLLWAILGWVRREIGHTIVPSASSTGAPVAALVAENVTAQAVSPLATPEQLAAERLAAQTVNTLPVVLMKVILRQQFLAAARNLYPDDIDEDNMRALDRAVDEYAMAAAFQQQLLDSMNPKFVTQVAPPHIWFGQSVPGSRILYDNPDTIYRFTGVNGASQYVITGRFPDYSAAGRPADVTFSVLEGLAGTTSSILTADDLEVNDDGTFTITVSTEPANGRPNHLQLTSGSTIIAARDTLGDWNSEVPMSLSITRVGGPPDSLFAQFGGFAFLGQFVSGNPLLTTLVSLVPPLPYMPPILRGVFTAVILVVRGASEQAKYMALGTNDPKTGEPREANVVSQPASNAEFLANQLQSNGHYQLNDDEALVLTIDPGDADYFIVPTYNIWTITDDYWNQQTSLNKEQVVRNDDGTYTVVISPTDPGVANWVSTGGLNQGTIAIRFQDLPDDSTNTPRIVDQRVVSHEALRDLLPPDDFVTDDERAVQLALRKAGFDKRWAPYPQT
jgi:Protein of unknown function (DUF1214)